MKMPEKAIFSFFFGPTAITVHDNGDMTGQMLFIDFLE
jgi:hypothetical protein